MLLKVKKLRRCIKTCSLFLVTFFASAMEYTQADTALMQAVVQQDFAQVDAAIKAGANINSKHPNFSHHTPLSEAVAAESDLIVSRLLCHPDIDIEQELERKWRALHIAVNNNRIKNVTLLLLHGARLDVQNNEGHTPLHIPLGTKMAYDKIKITHELLTCIPQAKTVLSKQSIFSLLCCFYRFKQGEGVGITLPKDIQKLLCRYTLMANVHEMVNYQLDRLQPALKLKDCGDQTPFEGFFLKLWTENNQFTPEQNNEYAQMTSLLNPENKKLLAEALEIRLCEEIG